MAHLIAPSLLAADFGHMSRDIQMIIDSSADWLHIDIMDGLFVPNISFGQVLMPFIKKASSIPLDVHLMIEAPERYVDAYVELGAHVVTVHYEACKHLHRTVQQIRQAGALAGVALNPHTPVELLQDVLEEIDLVCLMSVNPGFGGQKFIYRTIDKVTRLRQMITERNLNVHIEIDGGVGLANAESLLKAGADILVAGSSVFKAENPTEAVKMLKNIPSTRTF